MDLAEAKRIKTEKKIARRAALTGGKENSPRPMPMVALASPVTERMPELPFVSLMHVPLINKAAGDKPVATVAAYDVHSM